MKSNTSFRPLVILTAFVVAILGFIVQPVHAQSGSNTNQSDLVIFGPASNPGGLVGIITLSETNASEFLPAFLPASANVPNNIGVTFYEDASQTVVSDQLWTQAGFWYFASDPNLINFTANGITPVGSFVENGNPQDVSSDFLLPPNSMQIASDVEPVPEPGAFALIGASGVALLALLRRRP